MEIPRCIIHCDSGPIEQTLGIPVMPERNHQVFHSVRDFNLEMDAIEMEDECAKKAT